MGLEAGVDGLELSWGAFTGPGHSGVVYSTVTIHSRFIVQLDRREDTCLPYLDFTIRTQKEALLYETQSSSR